MKRLLYVLLLLPAIAFVRCSDPKIGYLITENVAYTPDTLFIPKVLQAEDRWSPDWNRVQNNAPWVTSKIEGVLGTQPLIYSLLDVKATEGGDAEAFRKEIIVRGGGVLQVPLRPESPSGRYSVSLNVANDGYQADLIDVFTFIIE